MFTGHAERPEERLAIARFMAIVRLRAEMSTLCDNAVLHGECWSLNNLMQITICIHQLWQDAVLLCRFAAWLLQPIPRTVARVHFHWSIASAALLHPFTTSSMYAEQVIEGHS